MGLQALGIDPVSAAVELITDPSEELRRHFARERVRLYQDDYEGPLSEIVALTFDEESVRQRLYRLIPLVGANSFLKRIADELARPIYANPPVRRVLPEGDQERYNELAREMELNQKMDLAARLLIPCNKVFLFPRYIAGVGLHLDVMTPHQMRAIVDPRRPNRAAALIYDKAVYEGGREAKRFVVVDDTIRFEIDGNGQRASEIEKHGMGRIPIIELNRRAGICDYWDPTTGQDLVAATKQVMLLNLLALKNHRTQSHIQLCYTGEAEGFIKDQVTDEDSILMANGEGNIFPINLQGDPSALLRTRDAIETSTAANYGISRERLNQSGNGNAAGDEGLKERTAELMQVLRRAELELFELVKVVSKESPKPLSQAAELSLDYGLLYHRVDRKTQLELRQTERSMGLRSGVDDVIEDNPELEGDRERAMEYIDGRMAEEAVIIMRRRALNIAEDATSHAPGQDPVSNGAMGPMVRDGKLSRDHAAMMAEHGQPVEDDLETEKDM